MNRDTYTASGWFQQLRWLRHGRDDDDGVPGAGPPLHSRFLTPDQRHVPDGVL